MRKLRLVAMLFAMATALVASLAVAAPAHAENPIVKLVSAQNGKCLQPASLYEGDVVIQQTCNGSYYQQWIVSIKKNKVHLQNRASGFCLEVRDGPYNGSRIDQWTCNSISNENWSFGITNNLLSSGISGTYSHCVFSPGNVDGLAVELRFCDGGIGQRWNRPPG